MVITGHDSMTGEPFILRTKQPFGIKGICAALSEEDWETIEVKSNWIPVYVDNIDDTTMAYVVREKTDGTRCAGIAFNND